jgi:hypothetical protein
MGGVVMRRWFRGALTSCLMVVMLSLLAEPGLLTAAAPLGQPETGEFRMIIGEPSSLDPNIATDFSIYTTTQLFESLYHVGEDGELDMLAA